MEHSTNDSPVSRRLRNLHYFLQKFIKIAVEKGTTKLIIFIFCKMKHIFKIEIPSFSDFQWKNDYWVQNLEFFSWKLVNTVDKIIFIKICFFIEIIENTNQSRIFDLKSSKLYPLEDLVYPATIRSNQNIGLLMYDLATAVLICYVHKRDQFSTRSWTTEKNE